ncbi:multicopper oxidase [Anopheles sinensis]|uniref:Multicopper oxidase n=1 Tax=Anopheles sinensis TaxID=74873 RepID=A0A084WL48_ANOSI|nr:multicopper oxidase [Anopheles sinensis]
MKTLRLIVLIVQRVLITAAVFFAAVVLIHFTGIDPKLATDSQSSLPSSIANGISRWKTGPPVGRKYYNSTGFDIFTVADRG